MLHVEVADGVATLRLAHGKAQALDLELVGTFRDTLRRLADDDAARALVVTGTGRIFCAGVDLFRLVREGPAYIDRFLPALVEAFRELFTFPRPVVAAVNGHAIAGGCVLACACDYRVMARGDATIGVPELKVGVPFPLLAIEILRFATSTAHLQELVYRGKTYRVEEAYERGLVDETVEGTDLLARAAQVAGDLASEPPARFRITKRQLRQPALERMETLAAETDAEVLVAWKDPDTLAAISAYLASLKRARPAGAAS